MTSQFQSTIGKGTCYEGECGIFCSGSSQIKPIPGHNKKLKHLLSLNCKEAKYNEMPNVNMVCFLHKAPTLDKELNRFQIPIGGLSSA